MVDKIFDARNKVHLTINCTPAITHVPDTGRNLLSSPARRSVLRSTHPACPHTNPLRGSLHVHPRDLASAATNSLPLSQSEPLPAVDTACVRALLKLDSGETFHPRRIATCPKRRAPNRPKIQDLFRSGDALGFQVRSPVVARPLKGRTTRIGALASYHKLLPPPRRAGVDHKPSATPPRRSIPPCRAITTGTATT